jgi:hypothetical protein
VDETNVHGPATALEMLLDGLRVSMEVDEDIGNAGASTEI